MIQGSLALRGGVLYVARHEGTARVRPHDLDGRALSSGFELRGPHDEACALGGIDVDGDRQVWLADAATARVRAFSLFGRETHELRGHARERDDARGTLRGVTDVALLENDDDFALVVASPGWRRHAVQIFQPDGRFVMSLRSQGDPHARFHGVTRVAARGRWIYVCEASAGRVQVFRDREFHFAFAVPVRTGARFEPVALAPLDTGHMLLAVGGAESALLQVDGAGRLVRVLAQRGGAHGQVLDPLDVVAEAHELSGDPRIAVIDRDGERVQIFTLSGRCHGELPEATQHAQEGCE